MSMRIFIPGAMFALAAVLIPAMAQEPAQQKAKYVSLIGTVEKVDASGKTFSIKPDKPGDTEVKFDDKTQFLRLPAGELDVKKASRAQAADVGVGDRVIARLRADATPGQPAVFFYFSKQQDLAQRQEKTREEWQTQGVSGTVKTVDPAAKQVMIAVQGAFGPPKDVTLDVSGPVGYQRYNLSTAKYDPGSTLEAIKVGDRVRVLGKKNADQTAIKVEDIMSGPFKTIPVQIKSIDVEAKQILATDLASKKPITIEIKSDTTLKKLDDATALAMARRLNPTFQNGRGQGRGQRGGGAADAGAAGDAPAGAPAEAAAAGPARGGRGGGGRGGFDTTKLLDQQPTIMLADLKAGEPIVVSGAAADDMSKIAATAVVAGVDPILRAAPQNGPDPLGGNWNLGGGGGDIGGSPE
jgi:hypothetical protein